MKSKSILILGAGFGQVPAINAAKEMGLEVVCIDRNPHAIGMALADFVYTVDVTDFEGALKIAKTHSVSAVFTMQSDIPIPTVGYINDALKLKGISLDVARACSDKVQTRKRLKEFNCAQPDFEVVTCLIDAKKAVRLIGLPCIIKAPDSSASRGVVKVNNYKEIEDAFLEAKSYTRTGEILVEEFIDGLEFGAQTFSKDGNCEIVLLHNDIISPPPYMIPLGHSFPFNQLSDEESKYAVLEIKDALNALGIKDGPCNVDLILDRTSKRVKVIEIGARIGATCLPELIDFHIGQSWVKMSIKSLLGIDFNHKLKDDLFKPIAAQIIRSPKDGVLVDYYLPSSNQYIIEAEITVRKGDAVSFFRKGTDRIGKVLATGNSVSHCEKNCLQFINEVEINVE